MPRQTQPLNEKFEKQYAREFVQEMSPLAKSIMASVVYEQPLDKDIVKQWATDINTRRVTTLKEKQIAIAEELATLE